jgi:hypothetical protein
MPAEMKVGQYSEAIDFDQCDLAYSVAVTIAILEKESSDNEFAAANRREG